MQYIFLIQVLIIKKSLYIIIKVTIKGYKIITIRKGKNYNEQNEKKLQKKKKFRTWF